MNWILYDPDEFETVIERQSYGEMFGHPFGSVSVGQRRRDPEEVARIKAEKRRAHEDAVLAEADAIRAARALLAQGTRI